MWYNENCLQCLTVPKSLLIERGKNADFDIFWVSHILLHVVGPTSSPETKSSTNYCPLRILWSIRNQVRCNEKCLQSLFVAIVIIFTIVEHYLPLCIGCNFGGNFLAFNGKMTKALGESEFHTRYLWHSSLKPWPLHYENSIC